MLPYPLRRFVHQKQKPGMETVLQSGMNTNTGKESTRDSNIMTEN